MEISREQYATLMKVVQQHELAPQVDKQMEFMKFGEGQPWNLLKFLVDNLQQLSPAKKQEFYDLATQVSLPEEVMDMATWKIGDDEELSEYHKNFQQFLYDPSASALGSQISFGFSWGSFGLSWFLQIARDFLCYLCHVASRLSFLWVSWDCCGVRMGFCRKSPGATSLMLYHQLGRFEIFNRQRAEEVKQFVKVALGVAILAVLLCRAWTFFPAWTSMNFGWSMSAFLAGSWEFMFVVPSIIVCALLLKIVNIQTEHLSLSKFMMMELGRCRQSLSTGCTASILMRIEGKLIHMEKRSQRYFAEWNDFWRDLHQNVIGERLGEMGVRISSLEAPHRGVRELDVPEDRTRHTERAFW